MQYIKYSTKYTLFHGIIHLGLDPNPSRHRFCTACPRGEVDLHRGQRPYLGARSYWSGCYRCRCTADWDLPYVIARLPPPPHPWLATGCRHQHLIFIAWRLMDLAPSCATMVAVRAGHMPRPYAAMDAARSIVSLLSGGSVHFHLKGPCLVLVIEWQLRWTNSVYVRYRGD